VAGTHGSLAKAAFAGIAPGQRERETPGLRARVRRWGCGRVSVEQGTDHAKFAPVLRGWP